MTDVVISIASEVAKFFVVPIGKQICYPFKYKSNMDELIIVRRRMQLSVDDATSQGEEIEEDVEKLMQNVDDFLTKHVVKLEDEDNANKQYCFIGFSPNLMTCYLLSKKAAKMAKDIAKLLPAEVKSDNFSHLLPLGRINSIYIRGYEDFPSRSSLFKRIMEALANVGDDLIGVHGMGGVGKTTLVKQVASQAKENIFDVVVIAEVTEKPDIKNIQVQIADELGLKFHEESLFGRAARLRDKLRKEKRDVLLVLDNIWTKLDLVKIGIPFGDYEKPCAQQIEDFKERNGVHQKLPKDGKKGSALQKEEFKERNGDQKPPKDGKKGSAQQKEDFNERNGDQKRCKILMTARNEDVLRNDMNVQKIFSVKVLPDEEARKLFEKIVGEELAKNSDFERIAIGIVQKCAGLPVAIATIANALRNKSDISVWSNALDQLRRANPRNVKGMVANVYSAIELSYNFLENEEAKSLFLLCGLCNASNHNINIDDLLRYGMGLGLFEDVYTLEAGRNRVHTLINDLKSSCLILDYDHSSVIKMHDIVHAVAVSIASTKELMFNIQNVTGLEEELEEKFSRDSTAVSMLYKDIPALPERVDCPKLKILLLLMKDLYLEIPEAFFEEMKQLKVLDLTRIHLWSVPSSLRMLTNLQTLCLKSCLLGDMAIIGELKKLKILSFSNSDIEKLPGEIGQLTRLKLLDLSNCSKLKVIPSNVLSSLTRLEELYMGNSFAQWEVEGRNNASLAELKRLSRLTTLDIHVLDAQIFPQDLFLEKLESYRIFIGDVWNWCDKYETSRTLKLKLNNSITLGYGPIQILLNRAEDLYLHELEGVNVRYELLWKDFQQLKHLHVQNGTQIQCIIDSIGLESCNAFLNLESLFLHNLINLEKICKGQFATNSFSKLRIMKVGQCDRLKHLFTFSIANNLLQLQEIEVTNCEKLEEIVFRESEELVHQNESIEFTQLRTLRLQCLPHLTSFHLNLLPANFSQNVLLPRLENLELSSINIQCMWLNQLPAVSSCCQTLTSLSVENCSGNLKFLFSYSVVKSLLQLKKLEIRNCKSIEGIINTEELGGEEMAMVFPKLLHLHLQGLPKLTRFSFGNSVKFHSLIELSIKDCPNLKTFSPASMSMEELNCHADMLPYFDQKVELPTLAFLKLSSINIQTIWDNKLKTMPACFESLTNIIIDGCHDLRYIFSLSMVKSLVQLKVLKISDCKFMERIVVIEKNGSDTPFPKLQGLYLVHLPELTSFCNFAGNSIVLPFLDHLWIENCPKMHEFVSNAPHTDIVESLEPEEMNSNDNFLSDIQPLFDKKVGFPCLKFLRIELMDNLRKIWDNQLTMDSFLELEILSVMGCNKLLSVFPSNMLRRLEKLKELLVSECDSLEVIFENLTKKDVEAVPAGFVFPQLIYLELLYLPRLKSFYPGSYISEWPMLKKLRLWRCDTEIILNSNPIYARESRSMFLVSKAAFPNLEELALDWNCVVTEMRKGTFSEYSCKLKALELIDASKETAIICPYDFLFTLPNLEKLDVIYGLLEDIFVCEGLDCKEKHVETPSKLRQLTLFDLKDSLHRWEENSLLCQVFQNLTSLEVLECNNLQVLVPSSVSFQNLTTLEVSKCNKLLNLMAVSTAKSLGQLSRLNISECKMLEDIITHVGDEVENCSFIFRQLKYLGLHFLPSLTSFFSGNYLIEFPSLQQVVVRQCPSMKIFSGGVLSTPMLHRLQITEAGHKGSWEGSLNTTVQKLFKDLVGFCGIEHLTLSEFPHLKEVWHDQFPVSFFSNLKLLVIDDICSSLKYIFTPSVASGLVKLQELEIKNCSFVEAIIVIEEERIGNTLFPNLIRLELKDLPQLTSFCNLAGPENSIELPSLAELWIQDCPNMETFNSNSTSSDMPAANKEDHHTDMQPFFDEKVGFPKLKFLLIERMDKLRKIWHDKLTSTSFWELECFKVVKCHKLLNVFPPIMFERLRRLEELWILKCDSVEEIFELQAFGCGKSQTILATQLKKLVLRYLPNLKHVWNMEFKGLLSFENLLYLEVKGLDSLKSIIPASIARNLLQLEKLWIKCCVVKEIVAKEEADHEVVPPMFVFPRLTSLRLWELSRLESIYPELYISEWPVLKKLELWKCDQVAIMASEFPSLQKNNTTGESSQNEISIRQPLFLTDKVAFPNLNELNLYELPQLQHLWKDNSQNSNVFEKLTKLDVADCDNLKTLVPSWVSLQNLTTLEVWRCNGLMNLMTFSTAKTLVQLAKMEIFNCKLLGRITVDNNDDVGDEVKDYKIVFNQLKNLELRCLPSLVSFCMGKFAIEFPSLEQVLAIECLKMETFSEGVLCTPKLQRLQLTENEDVVCPEVDLNTTIQQLFQQRIVATKPERKENERRNSQRKANWIIKRR